MRIGLLIVCTGNYHIFLQPLIDGIEKYFFVRDTVDIYLFTDREHELQHSYRIKVINIPTDHKPFPAPTLYRYAYFNKAASKITSDYLFYSDVDMAFVDYVDREILPQEGDGGLVATLHPGFYNNKGGSWEDRPESKAFVPVELRKKYYAGGFQGGERNAYLMACKEMAENITDDESRGITPVWHDESVFNCYLCERTPRTLTPEYCMVEEAHLREAWQISHFKPKIIALKKDHDELRK